MRGRLRRHLAYERQQDHWIAVGAGTIAEDGLGRPGEIRCGSARHMYIIKEVYGEPAAARSATDEFAPGSKDRACEAAVC